jgi:hypothetical protein
MSVLLPVIVIPLPFRLVLGMETYEELHRHNPPTFLQSTLELGFRFKSRPRAKQ